MKVLPRKFVALFLCVTIVLPATGGSATRPQPASSRVATPLSLRDYLHKSYLELFDLAPKLEFSAAEIEDQRNALKSGKIFA